MASTKASKRISSTSWIGSVGAEFDDFQVNLEENSRADLSSGEFQQILSSQQESIVVVGDSPAELMKVAVEGFAEMTLVEETSESQPKATTEKSSSTHNSSRRSGGRRKNQRMSLFTTVHTTTTLVSSTYHSSDLDSFSEESDMDDSDDDESLQASTKEGAGEEDEIKSILSSDFDSHDLDLEKNEGSDDDLEQNPRLSQRDNRSKLDWTNDQRWNTLETTPNFNPDPFVYPEGQQSSGSRMIMMSNSSIIPQVALDVDLDDDVNAKPSGGNRKKLEIIFQGEDEISLNDDNGKNDDGNKEFAVDYNDKKKKKKSVADVLERDPDSEHSSFMLEVGMQRQVSGLTVQSGVGTQRSQRTRRRGSKRNRSNAATAALQNETWNNDDDDEAPTTRHTNDAIPNQPLPPPPPQSETPLFGRRSFTGTEIIAQHKSQQQQKRGSHFSKVSKVSALSVPSDMEEEPNCKNTTSQRSRADSFDSSWDSSLGVSPITKNDAEKKKIRMDGDSVITSPDNPTFRATDPLEEQLDVPPPPPARCATPRASFQLPFGDDGGRPQLVDLQHHNMSKTSVLTFDHDDGRPQLVDLQHQNMSKTSVLTFDSGGVVSSSKQRNRNSLEKLNDQMNAAIGVVSSPTPGAGNNNSKASSIRMSIGQRRESVKRLREKLRDSFKHVISPGGSTTRGRKSLGQE